MGPTNTLIPPAYCLLKAHRPRLHSINCHLDRSAAKWRDPLLYRNQVTPQQTGCPILRGPIAKGGMTLPVPTSSKHPAIPASSPIPHISILSCRTRCSSVTSLHSKSVILSEGAAAVEGPAVLQNARVPHPSLPHREGWDEPDPRSDTTHPTLHSVKDGAPRDLPLY